MSKKNSLAAIRTTDTAYLQPGQAAQKPADEPAPVKTSKPVKKPMGRPPAADKAKNRVILTFTDSELEQLKEQAGLIPLATYLKSRMIEKDIV